MMKTMGRFGITAWAIAALVLGLTCGTASATTITFEDIPTTGRA
jgi:hypothetical protein